MPFSKDGDRISLSAEIDEEHYAGILLAFGVSAGVVFENLGNPAGWRFIEVLNELLRGDPFFAPYAIPEDRSLPFQFRQIKFIDLPATS